MNKLDEIKRDIINTTENSFELEKDQNIQRKQKTKKLKIEDQMEVHFDQFFFDNFSNLKLDLIQEKFKNIILVNALLS